MARVHSVGVRNSRRRQARKASAEAHQRRQWTVIDLFSGAGGSAAGFHRHGGFTILGAVDLEVGKPSEGTGKLQCNATYKANIGVQPLAADLRTYRPTSLRRCLERNHGEAWDGNVDVLISCAPCTGFSRAKSANHKTDDPRNALVTRSAVFVQEFRPRVFIMENSRELITGRFKRHHQILVRRLRRLGYNVRAGVYRFNDYGLPQTRERALIIAVRSGLRLRTLEDLWTSYRVRPRATTVRAAIQNLPRLRPGGQDPKDPAHTCPAFAQPTSYLRLKAIPNDGGDWRALLRKPDTRRLLIPAMKRHLRQGRLGSHSDAYGRLWWDRPAVTIKRECSHVGNGRYSHPSQTRLCSVREAAILQGFPRDYVFVADSICKMYRHVGDAVPPLISYQLAHLVAWMFTGRKPLPKDLVLPASHLNARDVFEICEEAQLSEPPS